MASNGNSKGGVDRKSEVTRFGRPAASNAQGEAGNGTSFHDIGKFIAPYKVTSGQRFRLKDHDPADTHHLDKEDKPNSQALLAEGVQRMAVLQDMLFAQDRRALLLIFQAMDAAGKDSTIKQVMSGVNPQGVVVHSFKRPSEEELDHDWLWRAYKVLPERGRIGIFNRSYYEEVLVVRVHEAILQSQKLPPECVGKNLFTERLRDMAHFEDYLSRNGTKVIKFFLNVSREEQKKRFLARLDEPEKNWKFEANDVQERRFRKDYMAAYEDAISATATKDSPWYVVPADNKWFTRLVVSAAIVDALQDMELGYPKIGAEDRKALAAARALLLREKD
jgi:PPK2 family polyphosphate:nucleotide phosphotransferase